MIFWSDQVGFPPEDIIFDLNIFPVATGMDEHKLNALDFIKATKWVKENLPYCHVSGGVSNVSFSFRGNNPVREAMHSVFLYHAIKAGMNMGIVNPTMLEVYDDIPKDLLERVEDVILNRRDDATERLLDFAESVVGKAKESKVDLSWRDEPLQDRITRALVKGIDQLYYRRCRRSPASFRQAHRGHRRSFNDRDERGRGSIRKWKNVLAPSGEIRTGHEKGGGLLASLYRRRKAVKSPRR